ncbi:hypothetical protein [Rhodococcus sp. B10]|uniref:hypothetical protein n=1 Tax=Rhodococcus sp. B10 TaxID=2695876 RepID=UPI00142FDA96|nr:hypothetical protein [Rhodococcus sp. B10]
MDGTFHTFPTADRGALLLWSSRPRLTDELYTHVEDVLQLPRTHKDFPTVSDLSMPAFHAMVEASSYPSPDGNGRVAGEQWEHMHSPDELAKNVRGDTGIEIPASTLSQLDTDATLAWYGDLHVEHVGAVFQMEAVRRDRAFLNHDLDAGVLSGRRAALDHYADALRHDLGNRLRNTEFRGARPDQLIAGQTSEWTEQARIAELRTWPGGAATQKVVADFDRAAADWHSIVEKPWTILPHQSEADLFREYDNRKHTFSSDMSRARTQEWADAAKPATLTPHRLLPAMDLTDADLRRRAAQQHTVDRGIRREPTPPQAKPIAQQHPQPRRIEPFSSHTMDHRRPSM